MAGERFQKLADRFVNAIELAGAKVLVGAGLDRRPLDCSIVAEGSVLRVELYLWTITPGGKGRNRPRERRIQLTNVDVFPLRPGIRTVLGGWSEEAGVFAFWDVRRHQGFTTGSSSLQISLDTLERAHVDGMAAETRVVREGPEVSVAVHADYLLWYLREYERLYECADDIDRAPDLVKAEPESERAFIDEGPDDSAKARRHKVVSIVQNFREARFRPQVLRAYNFRCAVTGIALRLVDAAHIIPVSDPASTDEPSNGIALNPLHHRAYDSGLLGILPAGALRINERIAADLRRQGLHDGLDWLAKNTPESARYPALSEFRPSDTALRRGLELRGWTADEISAA